MAIKSRIKDIRVTNSECTSILSLHRYCSGPRIWVGLAGLDLIKESRIKDLVCIVDP